MEDESIYTCKVCGEEFITELDMNIHYLEHDDSSESVESDVEEENVADVPPEQNLLVKGSDTDMKDGSYWRVNATKALLNLYKKHHGEMRTTKGLWIYISHIFNTKYGLAVSPANCENRWRVVTRNYRKLIATNGKGRKKKFEYTKELEEIYGPKLTYWKKKASTPSVGGGGVRNGNNSNVFVSDSNKTQNETFDESVYRQFRLQAMKDLHKAKTHYYTEKLRIEQDRLNIMKKRNLLIRERNSILEEKMELMKKLQR